MLLRMTTLRWSCLKHSHVGQHAGQAVPLLTMRVLIRAQVLPFSQDSAVCVFSSKVYVLFSSVLKESCYIAVIHQLYATLPCSAVVSSIVPAVIEHCVSHPVFPMPAALEAALKVRVHCVQG